ncbi:sigma-70 family RNA polymerase sigma factor [Polycyclovorans algicola]|uniref:sigma-70 family RNA polymerase sigma factor n=1 Tax=Polycyclovorans algicola TaxID=616992 RepID=UPI00190FBE2E|nr:sigma-70 family RNA polymerase sigma factor [Polycyclovorans algicola]
MLAWAGGDAGAFERLYRRHKDSLYRYFLRHVRPPDLAGEAFQDVWQKVIQSRDRYRADAPFAAWLYTLAHHRLMDHYRSQRPNDEMPDDLPAPEQGHPERLTEQAQQSYRLLAALQTLPPEQREIIVLREEQDFTLEQMPPSRAWAAKR